MAARKRVKPVVEEVTEETVDVAPLETDRAIKDLSTPAITESQIQPEVVEPVSPAPMPQVDTEPSLSVAGAGEAPMESLEAEPLGISEEPIDQPLEKNTPSDEKKISIKMIIVIAVVSALIAAIVSGGVYVYLSGVNKFKKQPAVEEETTTPAPATSASAEARHTTEASLAVGSKDDS